MPLRLSPAHSIRKQIYTQRYMRVSLSVMRASRADRVTLRRETAAQKICERVVMLTRLRYATRLYVAQRLSSRRLICRLKSF